jgi:hypothetical protein
MNVGIGFARKDHLKQHMDTHPVSMTITDPPREPLNLQPYSDGSPLPSPRKRRRRMANDELDGEKARNWTMENLEAENERLRAELRQKQEILDSINRLCQSDDFHPFKTAF